VKLKRLPDDFQVDERVTLSAGGGAVALYRLTKQSLTTLEALDAIERKWRLQRRQIAFAGLKDKHALTQQFVTIADGPRRGLTQENLTLEYLGQTARPIHAGDITANGFTVVIRDLGEADVATATAALQLADDCGVPNYFDDQRFGSLGESGQYIADPWCRGDYERTLWLAIAEPNHRDRPIDREEKRLLCEHWGDWPRCRERLGASKRQEIAAFLADQRSDFRRAIALLRQDLRSLWLAAYQSHLWNRILAAVLREECRAEQLMLQSIARSPSPFFQTLDADQAARLTALSLPLPSARSHLESGSLLQLYDRVLAEEGTALRQIRVKYPRDSFFSKGERPALFQPREVQHEIAADELYPGRQKLTLRFALQRGSYATILIKRLTGIAGQELEEDNGDDH